MHRQEPGVGIGLVWMGVQHMLAVWQKPALLGAAGMEGALVLVVCRAVDEDALFEIDDRAPIFPMLAPEVIVQ